MAKRKAIMWASVIIVVFIIMWRALHRIPPDIIFRMMAKQRGINVGEIISVDIWNDYIITFFLNENEIVCCSIIKEKKVFYEWMLYCSQLELEEDADDRFIIDGWSDNGLYRWMAWGLSRRKEENVYVNSEIMKSVAVPSCDFNIYYLLKEGDIAKSFKFTYSYE